jgi:hypothetical protein
MTVRDEIAALDDEVEALSGQLANVRSYHRDLVKRVDGMESCPPMPAPPWVVGRQRQLRMMGASELRMYKADLLGDIVGAPAWARDAAISNATLRLGRLVREGMLDEEDAKSMLADAADL